MVFVVRELRNSLHDQRSPRISSRQQSPAITTRMPNEEYMRKVQIPVLYKHFCYLKKYSPNCILIISIQLLQDVTNVYISSGIQE